MLFQQLTFFWVCILQLLNHSNYQFITINTINRFSSLSTIQAVQMRRLQSAGRRPGSKGCLSAAGGQRDKRLLQLTRLTSINEIRTNTQAAVHVPQIYRPLFKISFLPQQPNCWVCQPNGKIWESVALNSGSEGGVWGSCIVCTL